MSHTSTSVFADTKTVKVALTDPEFTKASSYEGWVSVDTHLGAADVTGHNHEGFAAVKVIGHKTFNGYTDTTLYINSGDADSIATATALRDALTKAIRHARKGATK